MPKPPRLNQLCDIYTMDENFRGDKTKVYVKEKVKCRFFEYSSDITNNEGEYISYDAYMHIGNDCTVEKNFYIDVCERTYMVNYAGHTRNLNGDVFMQFLGLVESYAADS